MSWGHQLTVKKILSKPDWKWLVEGSSRTFGIDTVVEYNGKLYHYRIMDDRVGASKTVEQGTEDLLKIKPGYTFTTMYLPHLEYNESLDTDQKDKDNYEGTSYDMPLAESLIKSNQK